VWASQVATGNENNLRFGSWGEGGARVGAGKIRISSAIHAYGKPPVTISRAGAGATASAKGCEPHPSGHPGGNLEAFAQLYTDLAEQIRARLAGREAAAASLLVPGVGRME